MATKKRSNVQLHALHLTKFELTHLRDLFGVLLATELKQTLSQALAERAERPMVEANLWNKVAALCAGAGLPLGDEAPSYVCSAASPPPLGVFTLATEASQEEQSQAADVDPFEGG